MFPDFKWLVFRSPLYIQLFCFCCRFFCLCMTVIPNQGFVDPLVSLEIFQGVSKSFLNFSLAHNASCSNPLLRDHCVWSKRSQEAATNASALSVNPTTILDWHHQLPFDIKQDNINCVWSSHVHKTLLQMRECSLFTLQLFCITFISCSLTCNKRIYVL